MSWHLVGNMCKEREPILLSYYLINDEHEKWLYPFQYCYNAAVPHISRDVEVTLHTSAVNVS